MKKNIIFLIGFMGSGKSTFGPKLSQALGYAFVDMDAYIEEQSGKTIPQIFAEDGESHFRTLETEAIHRLALQPDCVIATGGGAPCFNGNMGLMNELGLTVYLALSPEKIAQRLVLDPTERPVLEGKKGEDLLAHITAKLQEREPFYKQAQHIVDADAPEELLQIL